MSIFKDFDISLSYLNLAVSSSSFQMLCTNILIGVSGAGLEWLQFMSNASAIVEVGWPKYIGTLYSRLSYRRNILYSVFYAATNVTINWDMFLEKNKLKSISEEEKQKRMETYHGPNWAFENPFKFGDATMDVKKFIAVITKFVTTLERKFNVKFRL